MTQMLREGTSQQVAPPAAPIAAVSVATAAHAPPVADPFFAPTQTWENNGFGYDSGSSTRGFGFASGTGTARPTPADRPSSSVLNSSTSALGMTRAPSIQGYRKLAQSAEEQVHNNNIMSRTVSVTAAVASVASTNLANPAVAANIPAPSTLPAPTSAASYGHPSNPVVRIAQPGPLRPHPAATTATISVPQPSAVYSQKMSAPSSSSNTESNPAQVSAVEGGDYRYGRGRPQMQNGQGSAPPASAAQQQLGGARPPHQQQPPNMRPAQQQQYQPQHQPTQSSTQRPAPSAHQNMLRTADHQHQHQQQRWAHPPTMPENPLFSAAQTAPFQQPPATAAGLSAFGDMELSEEALAQLLEIERAATDTPSPVPPAQSATTPHLTSTVPHLQQGRGYSASITRAVTLPSPTTSVSCGALPAASRIQQQSQQQQQQGMEMELSEADLAKLLELEESVMAQHGPQGPSRPTSLALPLPVHTPVPVSVPVPVPVPAPILSQQCVEEVNLSDDVLAQLLELEMAALAQMNTEENNRLPERAASSSSTTTSSSSSNAANSPRFAPDTLLCMRLVALDVADNPVTRTKEVQAFQPGGDDSLEQQGTGKDDCGSRGKQRNGGLGTVEGTLSELITVELSGDW